MAFPEFAKWTGEIGPFLGAILIYVTGEVEAEDERAAQLGVGGGGASRGRQEKQ